METANVVRSSVLLRKMIRRRNKSTAKAYGNVIMVCPIRPMTLGDHYMVGNVPLEKCPSSLRRATETWKKSTETWKKLRTDGEAIGK